MNEQGFTVVELLVALSVAVIGLIGLVGTFDASRRLVDVAEKKEAAVHIGQQEIERIQALEYDAIALNAVPPTSADEFDPRSRVTAEGNFHWSANGAATEELALDAVKGMSAGPTPWDDGRLSGQIYRFVTWVNDASCNLLCPGPRDYKRVTVAITIDGENVPKRPILLSSLIQDQTGGVLEGVENGVQHVLEAPDTKCLENGVWVECAGSFSGNALTWFPYDTPATSSDTRLPIAGDHATHPTITPSDASLCNLLIVTTGCPKPDLMGTDPAPAPATLPPLYDYSSEQAGSYVGGRVLRRGNSCDSTPAFDNTKGQLWTTAPLSQAMTLTGEGGITLYSQALDGVSAFGKVCVRFYHVPNSLANLIAFPPTQLGRATYELDQWPTTPTPVSFNFDFLNSNVTIPAGNRIGVRVSAASSSEVDLTAIYDHPSYPTSFQLNAL